MNTNQPIPTPTVEQRKISWSTTSIIMTLAIMLVAYGLWQVRGLILVILTATVVATFITGITRSITHRRIPRVLVVITMYFLIFFVVGGLMYLFVPVFIDEIGQLSYLLPADNSFLTETIDTVKKAATGFNQGLTPTSILSGIQDSFGGSSGIGIFRAISTAFGGIINLVLVVVISFYLSIEDNGIERFVRAVTPIRYEDYAVSLWRRTEQKIALWFKGQLLLACILALLTYLGLTLFDVPYAFILSVLAGVMGLIPFGIFFAGMVALIIAFSAGGFKLMAMVFLWYTLLQQLEAYVLQPQIMRRVTGVPSIIILLSIIIFSSLLGFAGLILAIPCAVFFMEINKDNEERKKNEITAVAEELGIITEIKA